MIDGLIGTLSNIQTRVFTLKVQAGAVSPECAVENLIKRMGCTVAGESVSAQRRPTKAELVRGSRCFTLRYRFFVGSFCDRLLWGGVEEKRQRMASTCKSLLRLRIGMGTPVIRRVRDLFNRIALTDLLSTPAS